MLSSIAVKLLLLYAAAKIVSQVELVKRHPMDNANFHKLGV